jgi:hypothetical protein
MLGILMLGCRINHKAEFGGRRRREQGFHVCVPLRQIALLCWTPTFMIYRFVLLKKGG